MNIIDEKPQQQYGYNTNYSDPPPLHPTTSNYGNLPLEVSQSGGSAHGGGKESKLNANGKKFGKKLGNASKFHHPSLPSFLHPSSSRVTCRSG